jgi:CDP-glucose 4,6-dehydratase
MKSIFLTGHTGFKGAWLAAMLVREGFHVHGFSDAVRPNSLYNRADLKTVFASETFGDVRDSGALTNCIRQVSPDAVVHLAAQSLVLTSLEKPMETFAVNINGTLNVLEAALSAECPHILVVTTDKVYKDSGNRNGYSENDPLQGRDPYAASKAAADMVAQSWMEIHRGDIRVNIARGGNVIAGGEDSSHRLVTDIEASISDGRPIELRNPSQVRPWQHALDCLDGYLTILRSGNLSPNVWNVGPMSDDETFTAHEFAKIYLEARQSKSEIVSVSSGHRETDVLQLDSSRIYAELGWRPTWTSRQAIEKAATWFQRVESGSDPRGLVFSQVDEYLHAKGV